MTGNLLAHWNVMQHNSLEAIGPVTPLTWTAVQDSSNLFHAKRFSMRRKTLWLYKAYDGVKT